MDVFKHHRTFWNTTRKRSLYHSLLLLMLALFVQLPAGRFSAASASRAPFAGDLFLDNLPTVRMDWFIVQGAMLLWVASSLLLIYRPHRLAFGIKAIALLILIRAFFINLTHIGIYPTQEFSEGIGTGSGLYRSVTLQGNFFFSGHTGFPFLMALVFWNSPRLRRFFSAATVLFAAIVLLAHVHYSIDVFAAPFIVYSIFHITRRLFPEDYHDALFAPAVPVGTTVSDTI